MVRNSPRGWYAARAAKRILGAYLRRLPGNGRLRETPSGIAPLQAAVETRLRSLVCDAVGVDEAMLTTETSLTDDLALDSLDVLDVITRAESDLAVVYPEREAAQVRTFGEFVTLTTALVACSLRAQRDRRERRVEISIRECPDALPTFVRVTDDAPYDRELLADDLRAARPHDLVEVNTSGAVTPATVTALERAFARAEAAGVTPGASGIVPAPPQTPGAAARGTGNVPAGMAPAATGWRSVRRADLQVGAGTEA